MGGVVSMRVPPQTVVRLKRSLGLATHVVVMTVRNGRHITTHAKGCQIGADGSPIFESGPDYPRWVLKSKKIGSTGAIAYLIQRQHAESLSMLSEFFEGNPEPART